MGNYEGGVELVDVAPTTTADVAPMADVDLEIIQNLAKVKIESYNPEKKDEEESEWTGEQIGWYTMVTRYANGTDLLLLYAGLFGAFGFGACMPAFCYYFGTMIDGVASVSAESSGGMGDLEKQAFMMLYIGIGVLFVSWFQVTCLSLFAENIQFKIKIKYFESVLEKDATWFDKNNPTEMASKIAKEVVTI